jgi:hypothetical protein
MPEMDLGSRVFVLESKQEEYDRRQREQEERQRIQEDLIQKLANNTAVMNNTLTMLTDQVMPKVTAMEQQVIKNTLITQTVAWLAAAVVTGGIASAFALIS